MDAPAPSWQRLYADETFSWIWPPAYEPNSNPPELEQILSLLEPQPGARLLDLACGLGWLTIPVALRGFQVTGYDLSEAMLAGAQESAEQADAQLEWGSRRHAQPAREVAPSEALDQFRCRCQFSPWKVLAHWRSVVTQGWAEHRRRHAGVVFAAMAAGDRADRTGRATVVATVREGVARQEKVGAGQVYGAGVQRAVSLDLRSHRQRNRIVAPLAAVFQPARRVGALANAGCAAGGAFVLCVQCDLGDVEGVEPGHSLQDRLVVVRVAGPAAIGPHRSGGRAGVRVGQLRGQGLQEPFGRLAEAELAAFLPQAQECIDRVGAEQILRPVDLRLQVGGLAHEGVVERFVFGAELVQDAVGGKGNRQRIPGQNGVRPLSRVDRCQLDVALPGCFRLPVRRRQQADVDAAQMVR
ncbi:MAG: methyltransferase domain-containing protein [Caldilineaceae bacterium SB0661_bin_32]|uniref:Methyltransferase domain-containing protein n=1 Tax=Caldilineaceae bacterium SB0661_bin_32 TaxID=2605255 RepID=A0A6B1D244_9CHLR|nr:methyltransferase domain-containing protein [Chloroflexota bacterium]MYC93542.1 methyltransferase domain-containing protein [Caldilineaceae bacterium SB0661_bin_32]